MTNTFHDRNNIVSITKYGAVWNSFPMAYLKSVYSLDSDKSAGSSCLVIEKLNPRWISLYVY